MNSSDNEPVSSLTHFAAAILSVAGLTMLVVFSSLYGSIEKTVGFSIFGAGLILIYVASAVYHFISRESRAKAIFKIIDYLMIYVLIASTYTPLMLALPHASLGWALFGIEWGLALVGIVFKISLNTERDWLSPTLFIFMGWLSLITRSEEHTSELQSHV